MGKWQTWYEAQPQHIKDWYNQPRAIWYDSDMWKAFGAGIVLGVLVGIII